MSRKPRILYIEDEIKLEEEFPKILISEGYDVEYAENGDIALQKLRSREEEYDIIILDIMMPTGEEIQQDESAKEGFETGKVILRKLRRELKLGTPVVVLTAYGKPETESQLREYGISEFIGKPVSPTELLRYIQKHTETGDQG